MLKILFFLCFIRFSCQQCTSAHQQQLLACNSLTKGMQSLTEKQLTNLDKLPKPEVLSELAKSCTKAIDCVTKIDCPEMQLAAAIEKSRCQLVDIIGSALPCANKVMETVPKSANKYPCLKKNNIEVTAVDFQCKMLDTAGEDCIKPIVKDICGEKDAKLYDNYKQVLRPTLACATMVIL